MSSTAETHLRHKRGFVMSLFVNLLHAMIAKTRRRMALMALRGDIEHSKITAHDTSSN
jgi:hypothetical protein